MKGTGELMNKKLSEKKNARMYFKRWKVGMTISEEEKEIVRRFYPFMR